MSAIGECANASCDGAVYAASRVGCTRGTKYGPIKFKIFRPVSGSMNTMDKNDIFKALSSPVRRKILYWLKDICVNFPYPDYPPEFGVSASQINRRSGLSQSAISAHLSILLSADLVTANKSGTWIFFKRNEETIDAFLREIRCQL